MTVLHSQINISARHRDTDSGRSQRHRCYVVIDQDDLVKGADLRPYPCAGALKNPFRLLVQMFAEPPQQVGVVSEMLHDLPAIAYVHAAPVQAGPLAPSDLKGAAAPPASRR